MKYCPNCERKLPAKEFPSYISSVNGAFCNDCREHTLCNRFIKRFQNIRKYLARKIPVEQCVLAYVLDKRRKQFEQWVLYVVGRYGPDYEYVEPERKEW